MGVLIDKFRNDVVEKGSSSWEEAKPDVMYSTGFLPFDYMNGYTVHVTKNNGESISYDQIGIMDGSINMVIGRSGCGKTTFCIEAAGNIVRPFGENAEIYFDNIEGGDNGVRRNILAGFSPEEASRRISYRNSDISIENIYERVIKIYNTKMANRDLYEYDTGLLDQLGNPVYKFIPTVYIVDSLALLTPENITEEEKLSGSMSVTSSVRVITSAFKRLVPKCKAANIIMFLVNHITTKIEINPFVHTKGQLAYLKQGEALGGGSATIYITNNIIRIDDGTKLKKDEAYGVNGFLADFCMVKSRSNQTGKSVQMAFDFGYGFDPLLSLLTFMKAIGAINLKGSTIDVPGYTGPRVTQKTFCENMMTNVEFAKAFNAICKPTLRSLLSDTKVEDTVNRTACINNIMSQIVSI